MEIMKNKRYNDNITSRLNNHNNDRLTTLKEKKIFPNEDPNLNIKKVPQKIATKKLAFIGNSEKRSKLLFYENKNNLKFNNNMNNLDKKLNLKPLAEIKDKNNGRKRNQIQQISLINNKNYSSIELRTNNNSLTQNNVVVKDNNILLHFQRDLIDNKSNLNDLKDFRNKSTSGLHNNENNKNQIYLKFKERGILKMKNQISNKKEVLSDNMKNTSSDPKINIKNLNSKEKACIILSQSNVLQLSERIIFARASQNLISLISINDIMNSNEIFLKDKIKQNQLKLMHYNKKIETPFTPSKTADISLNIIKKEDEDLFKEFTNIYPNLEENEKQYYHTYICLLYILLEEDINGIDLKNINSNLLFDKLSKKGYEHFKDYLYLNFIKRQSNILNNDNIMNKFEELYGGLPDLIKHSGIIKNNKLVRFSYFLIKEIYDYRNNLKQLIDIKNKTKDYIDVLKTKCSK